MRRRRYLAAGGSVMAALAGGTAEIRRRIVTLGTDDSEGDGASEGVLTVQPETQLIFEFESDVLGEYGGLTEWYIDGESEGISMGPWYSTYYSNQGAEFWQTSFDSTGTYEVTAVADGDDDSDEASWTVTVEEDGLGSPSIDSQEPEDETLEMGRDETVELELDISHSGGTLDRVVWWLSQADIILGVSDLSGSEDTASIELEGGCHTCVVIPWIICEDGTLASEDAWTIDEDVGDPDPELDVTIEANDPVDSGDVLEVTAELTDMTGADRSVEADLIVGHDPTQVDSEEITLDANGTETINLEFETADVRRTQRFPARVEAEDASDEVTVEVIGTDDVGLDVSIEETNSPVQTGDELEATVELENTHDSTLTRDVQFVVGHDPTVEGFDEVTVESGDSETITMGYETADVSNPQRFPVRAETQTDSDTKSVYVYVDEPPLAVSIVETNDPVDAGEELVVTADIENVGGSDVEQEIGLIVGHDPQRVDTNYVRLGSGETETIDLDFVTATVPRTQVFPARVESNGDSDVHDVEVIGTEENGNGDAEIEIEFHSCTEASVSGTFEGDDSVTAEALFVDSAGPGNVHPGFSFDDVDTPFTGTVTFQVDDEDGVLSQSDDEIVVGIEDEGFGSAIRSVMYNWQGDDEISETNPSGCLEERLPERPSIDVADVETAVDGNEVTFEYENPNDLELLASEFVEGTTDDDPPALEPGEHSFTVEWTPESGDERLVWEVDLEQYLYDDVVRVETEPAREYGGYEVRIENLPESVEPGETLAVTAAIEAPDGDGGPDDALLIVDDEEVDIEPIQTTGDQEVILEYDVPDDEPEGELEVRVIALGESAEATVDVIDEGEAEFDLTIVETNDPVEPGEDLEVVVAVENVGDGDPGDGVELTLFVDGSDVATDDAAPESGDSSQVTFVYSVTEDDLGDLEIAISMSAIDTAGVTTEETADEEATTTVTVEEPSEPAAFDVVSLSAPGSIDAGSTLEVTADIENVGDEADETDVQLAVDGQQGTDSESVSLEAGEIGSVTLTHSVAEDASGTLSVTVSTDDDSESTSVSVVVLEDESPADDEVDAEPDSDAEPEPDPDSELEPDSDNEPEPDSEPDPEPDPDSETAPDTEPDSGPEPDLEPGTDEPASDPGPDPGAGPDQDATGNTTDG